MPDTNDAIREAVDAFVADLTVLIHDAVLEHVQAALGKPASSRSARASGAKGNQPAVAKRVPKQRSRSPKRAAQVAPVPPPTVPESLPIRGEHTRSVLDFLASEGRVVRREELVRELDLGGQRLSSILHNLVKQGRAVNPRAGHYKLSLRERRVRGLLVDPAPKKRGLKAVDEPAPPSDVPSVAPEVAGPAGTVLQILTEAGRPMSKRMLLVASTLAAEDLQKALHGLEHDGLVVTRGDEVRATGARAEPQRETHPFVQRRNGQPVRRLSHS